MNKLNLIVIALLLIPAAFNEMRRYERECKRDMKALDR